MIQDRAAGAIMGALIGDALGLGCHWYYDLDALRRDYGAAITGYTTPRPERYHGGMQAGQLSQSGLILVMLLRSVLAQNGYSEADFTQRLDADLFPQLDGTPMAGPGGYTNQSMREAWRRRVQQQLPWTETGGAADTTESAERAIVLAALYARQPQQLAEHVISNCRLTQNDPAIVAMSTAYNCVLAQLVAGERLTPAISDILMHLVHSGALPFHAVTQRNFSAPDRGTSDTLRVGNFSSPDALLTPHYAALAALDPGIQIEPAWKVALVYGLPCAIYHQLPAAYYLASRFADDFESAVLATINGGGQNMSRAMLTGALVGAQVGLSGIPQRFIDGLEKGADLIILAQALGAAAGK
ncbi:MAG: ADP-ribosylglycohydrolase family protein [Pseudomonadota bacterium]